MSGRDVPPVAVIIVSYNTADALRKCLESLSAATYPNFFTIVIDNASSDGSAEMVGREFPDVTLVAEKENHGFAQGNNVGISRAIVRGAEYFCLLNPDTKVSPGFLEPLVEALLKNESVWLAGPKSMLAGERNRVHSAGGFVHPLSCFGHHYGYRKKDGPRFSTPRECDFITACCWLLSRKAFERTEGFHEPFFLYFEDTDLCTRIRKAGGKIRYVPGSVIEHSPCTSTGGARHPRTVYYLIRNQLLYIARSRKGIGRLASFMHFIAYNAARALAWLLQGRGRQVHAMLLGVSDFISGRFGRARHAIANPELRWRKKQKEKRQPRLLLANPIGHTGQAYPDEMMTAAIAEKGWDVTYVTCREYTRSEPEGVKLFRHYAGAAGNRLFTAIAYASAQIKLPRLAIKSKADVIHLENLRLPLIDIPVLIILKLLGFPLAYMAHDVTSLDPGVIAQKVARALYTIIYRLVDSITVFSNNARRELILDYRVPPEKVHRVAHGNFVSLHEDAPKKAEARMNLDLAEDRPVLLFFGTIKKAKGLDVLLDAMARVRENRPDVLLVIAGKMWRHGFSDYENKIADLGLKDNVRAELGFVPYDRTNAFYSAADIIVLPYLNVYFSAVVMEAMSSGRPVVASAVGVIPELVKNGGTGLLAKPGDAKELAELIIKLLNDEQLRENMGKKAKIAVIEKYGWGRTAGELVSQCMSLLPGR
ncbi:MAG: glycosyltransferase [Planctomycetota bacterium]